MSLYDEIKQTVETEKANKSILDVKSKKAEMLAQFETGTLPVYTTHFKGLDELFKLRYGKMYIATGWPNHGKTEFVNQLCLYQAIIDGRRGAIWSPEADVEETIDTLIHTYVGKSTYKHHHNRMTKEEYSQGFDKVTEMIDFLTPEDEDLESLIKCFEKAIQNGCQWLVIDPYNEIDLPEESISERTRKISKKINRLAVKHNILVFLIVHPTGTPYDAKGELIIPTYFHLEGGRMLGNKATVVFTVHRKNINDPDNKESFVMTSKIKNKKVIGYGGRATFEFNIHENRYYWNGENPLTNGFTPPKDYNPNKFTNFNQTDAPW